MIKKNYRTNSEKIVPLPEAVLCSMEVAARPGYTFQYDPSNHGYWCTWGILAGQLLGEIIYCVQYQGFPEATESTVLAAMEWMVKDKEAEVKVRAKSAGSKSKGVKHD